MSWKKMLSIVIVVELLLMLFASISATASPKATQRITGGVYNPGDDWQSSTSGGVASYGNATFYVPNADQDAPSKYDVQYYGYQIENPPGAGYPHYYGYSHWWKTPENLHNYTSTTEYMVVVETINGINDWSGANFTGSTNMTASDPAKDVDYLPNIYLEQIPTPKMKSRNYTTGEIIINWTGLNENISDNCLDGNQKWKIQTSNIVGYSVYRSNGGPFERIGNAAQNRSGEVFFVDTVEPGDYYYRIAVNYRYGVNDGTNIIDENDVNPNNTKGLPGIFVSTGRSNVSDVITMPSKPVIILNSPNGGQDWTGGSTHDISYTISTGAGTPNYQIWLNYTIDGGSSWNISSGPAQPITHATSGTYTYPWVLPKINSTMVEVRVTVIDANSLSDMEMSDAHFEIDSKAPNVVSTTPGNNTIDVGLTDLVSVVFNEPMDHASTKSSFSITPDPDGWNWSWNSESTIMTSSHNPFSANITYNCTINTSAKDDSIPGNSMSANYSWSFKVVPGLSITIVSPSGGEKWTGNTTHNITYWVVGGAPNYTVYINYTVDGEIFNITKETNVAEGLHICPWTPQITGLKSVTVKVEAIDSLGAPDSDIRQFTIDSTKPEILIDEIIPSGPIAGLTQPIIIQFSEEMNTSSVSYTCTPSVAGGFTETWSKTIYTDDTLTLSHATDFTMGTTYTFNITAAKDSSDPGNPLNTSYSWSFTAVEARGDLTVVVNYPSSPEVGKNYKITVKIYNDGPKAINVSGSLTVTFYVNNKVIDTKTVQPIQKDASAEVSSEPFSFDGKGSWSMKVKVSSTNTADLIEGSAQPYEEMRSVNVVQPIGIGPYILIAVMVVLVVIVGAITLFGIKKKKKTG